MSHAIAATGVIQFDVANALLVAADQSGVLMLICRQTR
jgi:hypothetical protein